jgi:phosphate transport system substrate-binding protein
MRAIHLRAILSFLAALGFVMATAGCNSSKQPGGEGQIPLIGAGSTFVYPVMTRWISGFHGSNPNVQINYQSIGSGGGIQQLKQGLVDFGASDAALDDGQLKTMPAIIQIPESAGPVCVTYNLPGLKIPLKLSGATLAGIYLGQIKSWQDPAIRNDNPGVTLPQDPIAVAHRSDGSGTTNIFTAYLDAISPDWHKQVGRGISVSWPVGLGGKGSEGVTGVVKQTPGGIGYVELTYAAQNSLPTAQIRNRAGEWISPTAAATTAAIQAFQEELSKDVRTPIVDPPPTAKDAYPISGLTFLMVPLQGSDAAKRDALKKFIAYIIGPGQDAAGQLSYARLPQSLQSRDQALLDEMRVNGPSGNASGQP